MMNLNSTNEEIEALKYFLDEGNKIMNQLLISNCETDIALLSNETESKASSISYERESIISNLLKIKALYTLILKQYYKVNHKSNVFYRGTDLSEIDRLKNEPFIDKMLSATQDESIAEDEFASNWNRPICMNLKLNSDIPYLIVKDVLEDSELDEVVIAPFTKIKAFDLVGEKQLSNNAKTMKVYNVELEKQDLEELTDRERFGLYNYILDNSHLIKRKLEECISLEEENAINFENIRKLEQLLVKYENSAEEKESDLEYSDINRQNDYDDVERINKELEDLKLVTTRIFEKRKDDINFVNMWKRNIAVYMIAECKEIEKKFYGMKTVTDETIEIPSIKENIQNSENNESIKKQEFSDTTIVLNTSSVLSNTENTSEEIEENENLDEKANSQEDEKIQKEDMQVVNEEIQEISNDDESQLTESVENTNLSEVASRVKTESKENIEAAEELIKNIKNLISKQQNHARIAGTIGSTYSALNNAFEMKNAAEAMLELLKKIDIKIEEIILEDDNEKLENISKVNIEISTLINYLNNPRIALRNTKVTRFEEMAIIEENELKRGIAERIREIRGEAELKKLKYDLEQKEDEINLITRFIGFFTGQNKLDEVIIEQIDVRQKAIRKNLSKRLSLAYNYSIHELMAEIEMFVEDNDDDYLVEDDVKTLEDIAENLRRNYIISDSKVDSIVKKKEGKNLPLNSRKISKCEAEEIETYRFLNKYGYDIELKNDEPKYQDTMASEIARIVEYINSSKIF